MNLKILLREDNGPNTVGRCPIRVTKFQNHHIIKYDTPIYEEGEGIEAKKIKISNLHRNKCEILLKQDHGSIAPSTVHPITFNSV